MKTPTKEHVTMYGPLYAVLTVLLGGGGFATLTDNLPITSLEFHTWAEEHTAKPHAASEDAIKLIAQGLRDIRIDQTREALKRAYLDKCANPGAAGMAYIDKEIERLREVYLDLTTRGYDPPPCPS